MADWVNITNSQVDPDAPLASELAYAWRDNVIAAFEGASGAPRLQPSAWPRAVDGTVIIWHGQNTNTHNWDFMTLADGLFSLRWNYAHSVTDATLVRRTRRGGVTQLFYNQSSGEKTLTNIECKFGDLFSVASETPVSSISNVRVMTNGSQIMIIPSRMGYFEPVGFTINV